MSSSVASGTTTGGLVRPRRKNGRFTAQNIKRKPDESTVFDAPSSPEKAKKATNGRRKETVEPVDTPLMGAKGARGRRGRPPKNAETKPLSRTRTRGKLANLQGVAVVIRSKPLEDEVSDPPEQDDINGDQMERSQQPQNPQDETSSDAKDAYPNRNKILTKGGQSHSQVPDEDMSVEDEDMSAEDGGNETDDDFRESEEEAESEVQGSVKKPSRVPDASEAQLQRENAGPARQDTTETQPANQDEDELQLDPEDLFGQGFSWNFVMSAKRDLVATVTKEGLRLQSPEATAIQNCIEALGEVYLEMGKDGTQLLAQNDSVYLEDLETSISAFKIDDMDNPRTTMEDVFCHIIPEMVDLVDLGINVYSPALDEQENLEQLNEVIRLFKALIQLCQCVTNRKQKPTTTAPVVKPVQQKILPKCRAITKKLTDEWRMRRTTLAHSRLAEDGSTKWEQGQATKRAAKEQEALRRRIAAASFLFGARTEAPRRPAPLANRKRLWTDDEDDQLMRKLALTSDIPIPQRYEECLNCKALQSLHSGLIRERALQLKPSLESFYSQKGAVPDWVQTIE